LVYRERVQGTDAAAGSQVEVRPGPAARAVAWAGFAVLVGLGLAFMFRLGFPSSERAPGDPLTGSWPGIRVAELAFAVVALGWSSTLLRLATARWVFDEQGVTMRGLGYDRRHPWKDVGHITVGRRRLSLCVNSRRHVLAYPDARSAWETIRSWSSTRSAIDAEGEIEGLRGSLLSARGRRLELALAVAAIAVWWLVDRVFRAWLP